MYFQGRLLENTLRSVNKRERPTTLYSHDDTTCRDICLHKTVDQPRHPKYSQLTWRSLRDKLNEMGLEIFIAKRDKFYAGSPGARSRLQRCFVWSHSVKKIIVVLNQYVEVVGVSAVVQWDQPPLCNRTQV